MREDLVKRWRQLFPPKAVPPYDITWEADDKWYQAAKPKPDVDYSDVKAYAEKKYAEMCSVYDTVDKKAEWLFGIAFASSGALIAALNSWKMGVALCFLSVPAFGCFVLAMALAIRARMPGPRPSTMTIKDMVSVRERDPAWMLALIGSTHCAATGLRHVTEWKSGQLSNAARFLIAGSVLFFVVLLAASPFVSRDPVAPLAARYPYPQSDTNSESARSNSGVEMVPQARHSAQQPALPAEKQ